DSRAVLFWSDRNGPNQVFRQNIDQQNADTIASGPDETWMPRVSPDGKFILFVSSPKAFTGPSQRIMRVGSSGEAPQVVMEVMRLNNFACTRKPSNDCFMDRLSEDGKRLVFSAFDPTQGSPHEVLTIDIRPGALYNWMPSPDGSRIVFS